MHNIAEGFDPETNPEFIRFLQYAKRSCTEVQSELYVVLDEEYIAFGEFKYAYELDRRIPPRRDCSWIHYLSQEI